MVFVVATKISHIVALSHLNKMEILSLFRGFSKDLFLAPEFWTSGAQSTQSREPI
jgi:hypothetical protein